MDETILVLNHIKVNTITFTQLSVGQASFSSTWMELFLASILTQLSVGQASFGSKCMEPFPASTLVELFLASTLVEPFLVNTLVELFFVNTLVELFFLLMLVLPFSKRWRVSCISSSLTAWCWSTYCSCLTLSRSLAFMASLRSSSQEFNICPWLWWTSCNGCPPNIVFFH